MNTAAPTTPDHQMTTHTIFCLRVGKTLHMPWPADDTLRGRRRIHQAAFHARERSKHLIIETTKVKGGIDIKRLRGTRTRTGTMITPEERAELARIIDGGDYVEAF